ncbi:MAG: hypothetical protein JST04_13765 [Bdellovibrionales bacterium]|nr:hypothetical protein [Bdellovibrionales bacterium]
MHIPRMGRRSLLSLAFAASLFAGPAKASSCSLVDSPNPPCFHPHVTPTFKIIVVHYGDHAAQYDFEAAKRLYVERFNREMGRGVTVEIVDSAVIPLKVEPRDLVAMESHVGGNDPAQKTRDRLERLWYYYFSGPDGLIDEVRTLLLDGGHRPALEEADAVLVVSEPQFEALGFASGAFGFTEQPSEIAWALSDGGRTEWQPSARLVDELMHETGHLLGLDHASAHCFADSTPPNDRVACCAKSAGRNDVMSYCRDRAAVKGNFYYGFTDCTRKYVRKTTARALLRGEARPFQDQACD